MYHDLKRVQLQLHTNIEHINYCVSNYFAISLTLELLVLPIEEMVFAWFTKIPLQSTAILFLSSLCEACSFTVMLGYMPDLLHRFGTPWTDVGVYQGQIVGLNSFTYGVFNFAAGFLIDRLGVLKFFLFGTVLQIAVMLFAAFIYNIQWMYVTAFFIGLSSSSRLALKVMAYEMSNESNVSEIMTYALAVPSSFGYLIGPSIGGFLALPTEQYKSIFPDSYVLELFPVLLPHLFIVSILLTTLILTWSFLKNSKQESTPESESLLNRTCDPKKSDDEDCPKNMKWSRKKVLEFVCKKNVIMLICIALMLSITNKPSVNVFSIWVLTPSSEGGMGFSPMKNGQLKFYASLIVLGIDLVVPIAFLKKIGYVRGSSIAFIAFSMSISLLWLPSRLSSSILGFVTLLSLFLLGRIASSIIRVAYLVMVKNVTPVSVRGRVLAVDSGVCMLTRTASQVIFGGLFSWSLSNLKETDGKVSFPLNEPLTFYVISFFAMLGAFSAIMCDQDVERPCNE